MSLQDLYERAQLWRGRGAPPAAGGSIPSGFPMLDEVFPGGGWPVGALTEILVPHRFYQGLELLLPALARLSRGRRWVAWVAPPYVPYAPALAQAGVEPSHQLVVRPRAASDGLWALEQVLRCGTCSAVLAWPLAGDYKTLRRLQLAAEAGASMAVLFRPAHLERQPSPAALRLRVEPSPQGVAVHVLKRRGGWSVGPLQVRQ